MKLGNEIRKAIQDSVIRHPRYVMVCERLETLLQDHLDGLGPGIELVGGPSRCGKTEVLRAIERKMPPYRDNGRLVVPVLFVPVASGTAPTDLPTGVIQALNLPVPREGTGKYRLFESMLKQLALAKVQLVLFDEVSHLVDTGTKTPSRQAGDWFKQLHDLGRVSVALSGLYRTAKLLDSNEQLRNRARQPINFQPYRWDDPEDRVAFAGCVQCFMGIFTAYGCQEATGKSFDSLLRHLYAASAGHVGLLANVFLEVAKLLTEPTLLRDEHFQRAVQKLNLPGNGAVRPFANLELADEHLMYVLSSELAKYDVVLEPLSAAAAVANLMTDPWRKVT